MIKSKFFGSVLLFLVLAAPAYADAVDDYVAQQMQKQHIPGLSLAVIKDGKPTKVKGYGLANVELNVAATPDTVFRIGSMSKQMIATAILLLAHDGKLSLDDKAVKFLADAPDAWSTITIRHLLTHTSGLVREGPAYTPLRPTPDAELIKSAYAVPLVFKPGEKWQYSNLGYFILAEVIAKVSGQPWPEFAAQRMFKPLKMDATQAVDVTPIVPNRASGYAYSKDQLQNSAILIALRPSGAFMSSMNDLIKWDAALNRATLLPQATLNEMWTPAKLNDGSEATYGFGFEVRKTAPHPQMSHGGAINGFRSYYLRLPDDNLSVIVLTNLEAAMSDTIALGVAARYVKGLFPDRHAVALGGADLDAVVGAYQFRGVGRATIVRDDKALRFRVPQVGIDSQLLPESTTTFYLVDDPRMTVVFDRDANGRIDRASIKSGSNELTNGKKE